MKTLPFKLAFLLILATSWIQTKGSNTFEKNIHKSWPIERVKALAVDNKFGNINFVSTRDDSVVIDIDIEIEDKKAEFLSEQLEFRFSFSNGTVLAKTEFGDKFKTNSDFKIVYTINIPIDRNLTVENKYGDVRLGDLNASGNFEIKYGNIQGFNMNTPDGEEIKLELKYGSATFQNINTLNADVGYSNIAIGNINKARLDTKYSIVKLGVINNLWIESKYDNYKVKGIGDLYAESKYTQWDIINLASSLNIENEHGEIDIQSVSNDFNSIAIESDYANIKIGLSKDASYKLTGECYYCDIDHHAGNVIKDIKDNHKNYKRVDVGNTPENATIKIESRYGDINLKY